MKIEKKCVVCQSNFFGSSTHGGKRTKPVRKSNSITCSKECARYYRNITRYLQYRLK